MGIIVSRYLDPTSSEGALLRFIIDSLHLVRTVCTADEYFPDLTPWNVIDFRAPPPALPTLPPVLPDLPTVCAACHPIPLSSFDLAPAPPLPLPEQPALLRPGDSDLLYAAPKHVRPWCAI